MIRIDLSNRTALVTGGTGSIGLAICKKFAECGANVVINYNSNVNAAKVLKNELESNFGVKVAAIKADITDKASIAEMKHEINDIFGFVDILIVNAMAFSRDKDALGWDTVLKQDIEEYEQQFRFCVLQAVLTAKIFVPDMMKQKYGRIIGINTISSMQMSPCQSAYASGKRAMDGIYKTLAKEVGSYGITVNEVAPGWTLQTGDNLYNQELVNLKDDYTYLSRVPLGRFGTTDEVANAACFLASDLAAYITGVYLPVCGGVVAPCI